MPIEHPWIQIVAIGDPVPQGSTRPQPVTEACKVCGQSRVILVADNRPKLKQWWGIVRKAAQAVFQMRGEPAIDAPVELDVTFYLSRVRVQNLSGGGTRQVAAPGSDHDYPDGAPDADKLLRAVGDALSRVAYLDDKRIVDLHVRKRWAERAPGATIRLRPMPRLQRALL